MSSSPLRLTGLMSGMDTQSIVDSLMKIENMKVDKQFQTATKLQYKIDAYKDVNAKLSEFQAFMRNSNTMMNRNSYNKFDVNFGKTNDNKSVSISTDFSAVKGNYSIGVYQLAKSAKKDSVRLTEKMPDISTTTKLKDMAEEYGITTTEAIVGYEDEYETELVFETDGTTPVYEEDGVTQKTTQKLDANGQPIKTGNKIAIKESYIQFGIQYNEKNADGNMESKTKYYALSENSTIQDLANAVNADKDTTGVAMRFSQISGKISFESKNTGKDQDFRIVGSNAGGADDPLMQKYNEAVAAGNTDYPNPYEGMTPTQSDFADVLGLTGSLDQQGQNSIAVIQGERVERSSNSYKLDGIGFELNKVTEDLGGMSADDYLATLKKPDDTYNSTGKEVEFGVTQNTDEPVEFIKEFMNKYNEIVDMLNTYVTDKTYKDYPPLTDEERSQLTEKQQEDWDAKAKSGVLRRDSAIQGLLGSMRTSVFDVVGSAGLSLADIGITTSKDFLDGGKLVFDENNNGEQRLKDALANNPEGVMNLFTSNANYTSSDSSVVYKNNGVAKRLENMMKGYVDLNKESSLSAAETQQKKANDKWTELVEKLVDIENNYYKKFTAMETAMAKLQSQTQALAGLFTQ